MSGGLLHLVDMDLHQDVTNIFLHLRFSDDSLSATEVIMPRELAIDVINSIARSTGLTVSIA